MGSVNQTPALINRKIIQQILYWPSTTIGDAVINFLLLFSNVNMHRYLALWVECCQYFT